MHTRRTPDIALWDHYRALREQWMHEDNLVAQRMGWLIWSEGLMFTAFGAHARDKAYWLLLGFPIFLLDYVLQQLLGRLIPSLFTGR